MRSQMAARNESLLEDGLRQGGVTRLPRVSFRADPAASGDGLATWLWLQFYGPPGERERELLDSVLRSWFVLGRLGGYNAQNMQVGR